MISTVLYEREGHVATLTIDRPERRNAMTFETIASLRAGIKRAQDEGDVRVIVITGAGDRAFCAGADLGSLRGEQVDAEEAHEGRGHLAGLFTDMWESGIPTIARVRGYALAGGMGLALACDFVIAAEDAVFGVPEAARGLWPFMVTVPLLRSMPAKTVLDLMLTARRVDAAEGDRIGFVNRVVPVGELDAVVADLAATISANSPSAIRLGRTAFYRALDMPSEQALALLHASLSVVTATEDAKEGVAAFQEKRDPVWTMRNRTPENGYGG
jgi:enoyl-CoA hydratase/carnithine racemase